MPSTAFGEGIRRERLVVQRVATDRATSVGARFEAFESRIDRGQFSVDQIQIRQR